MLPGTPGFDDLRALGDVALAGEPAAAVVGVVTLSPALTGLAQMTPQLPTQGLVSPDILVNRLVADAPLHQSEATDMADDLFRRQVLAQQLSNQGEVTFGVVAVAPGSPPTGYGFTVSSRIAVARIVAIAGVAVELTPNSAAVAPHLSGDLGQIKALP